MKDNNQTYKSLFLILVLVLGVATLYAVKTDEAPRFILFLGRFHPLLLHLPIGALVVTFFIDILGRIQKNYPATIIRNLLGFTAVFSIITCFFGYFLSLEGGYTKETLDLHLYSGIITAVVVTLLFMLSLKSNLKSNKLFLSLFVITLIAISVAGHYGSVLTHGDQFLTEYVGTEKEEKTIENIDSLKLYNDVVTKILDKKCIQCHNSTKQKGELSLISEASILKGGVNGTSAVAGNASASLLYSRLLLPITDKEHMPPEGKAQLTKDEIWLLKHWIDEGLDFKNYATAITKNDTLKTKLKKYLIFNKIEIPKASQDAIENIRTAGFRVLELVPGEAELNVKSLQKTLTKETIDKLALLDEQIIELDLSYSEITDDMTTVIKSFKNLKTLRINSNTITDASVKNLKTLQQLEVLNIYNTSISNEGLSELLKSIQPKQLYTWQTKVEEATAKQLATEYNVNIQNSIVSGFIEDSQLEQPRISPEKTIFIDTIHVTSRSRIKDVALRYTLNGNTPDSTSAIFNDKIIIENSTILKVAAFKEGWKPSDILVRDYHKVKQKITSFTIKEKPDERYPDAKKLFDLDEGSLSFQDKKWVGYFGNDINTTIDLGSIQPVEHISFSCIEDVGSWILYPTQLTVYASNTKNGRFNKVGELSISRQGEGGEIEKKKITLPLKNTKARYFKIHIKNYKTLPEWHPSAGNPSWLFVDEIYLW